VTFPDPLQYDFPAWVRFGGYYFSSDDVVAFGVEPSVENLIEAYTKGIFPWPMEGVPLPWFCPGKRAVLSFADLHIPRSLARERRKQPFTFTIDKAFREVVTECSRSKRGGQNGTWITPELILRYTELHEAGYAHSVEAWDAGGNLAGGLYGVDAGGTFTGESMFYNKPNASKLALLYLIDHLASRGSAWIDIQVMTPHMKTLGAIETDRVEFLDKLKLAQRSALKLF
jgi:leucyl/phenylalanyl-tRNA--protein transferase